MKGYAKSKYYWEFVQILRKFLIVLAVAFLRNQQSMMIYSIIPLVAIFFFIHIYNLPYDDEIFNNLETFSLLICFMSYYLMVYITFTKSENTQVSLFIFILCCNLVFLLFWAKYYFRVIKKQAKYVISNLNSKINSLGQMLNPSLSLKAKNKRNYLQTTTIKPNVKGFNQTE